MYNYAHGGLGVERVLKGDSGRYLEDTYILKIILYKYSYVLLIGSLLVIG